MQVVNGDQNGYPVSGGIVDKPARDYKYCGLALKVGVWATGRQTVIVKNLTVWKHKLWPRKSLSGIDLGSGKGLMR